MTSVWLMARPCECEDVERNYEEAWCESAGCHWSAHGRNAADRGRDHAVTKGHAVGWTSTSSFRFRPTIVPASRAVRADHPSEPVFSNTDDDDLHGDPAFRASRNPEATE